MRHSRLAVFAGAIGALAAMTVLSGKGCFLLHLYLSLYLIKDLYYVFSAYLGWITQLIPRVYTFYISTALFFFFGLKMLHEGYYMSSNEGQECYEEAQAEVSTTDADLETKKFSDLEAGGAATS